MNKIEHLMDDTQWDMMGLEWNDQVDSLNAKDLGFLMYKLIEKNVIHNATQRHMMYDVLSALEEHID
ncbi:MAG: hypothetical protein GOVbin225_54 [Prokaryotic dsDNA virus sp.]|nr:MAG: hypothetical protein GOVbin225_54 [Prokaryotic dsDNA virus sp.]|tara:strand:+ start:2997 stop:3197 length:201 start_codon:yes stop_codon:yes gene_type:complete